MTAMALAPVEALSSAINVIPAGNKMQAAEAAVVQKPPKAGGTVLLWTAMPETKPGKYLD
jgi:hypothetical protein